VTALCLALVALLAWQHLAHRRERDELRACAEVELPDDDEPMVVIWATRDEALADAAGESSDDDYVVIHERAHPDDACSCQHLEVHRVTRGQA
jgi:hypothetical protein